MRGLVTRSQYDSPLSGGSIVAVAVAAPPNPKAHGTHHHQRHVSCIGRLVTYLVGGAAPRAGCVENLLGGNDCGGQQIIKTVCEF